MARGVGNATVLVWADMYDPVHNARDDYYQVRDDFEGSWAGLDPSRVIVVNWWSGDRLRGAEAPGSVAHFAGLGFRQIVAGYYEEDVADNRAAWRRATAGAEDTIVGSMFYTNPDGYRDLAEFGRRWWR